MQDFSDQVVLITGAGRGVGRELALAFAASGAIIAANDITPINLDDTIAEIIQSGGRAKDYVCDVSKKMPIQAMLNEIIDDWGQIDILINNAHVDPSKSLLDLDEWDWRRTIDVNLTGPFLTMQSVGRIMKEASGGTIVNVISAQNANAASKSSQAGLARLSMEIAEEFSAYNIRVNAVSPHQVGLPFLNSDEKMDITQAVFYLCNPKNTQIQGQIMQFQR